MKVEGIWRNGKEERGMWMKKGSEEEIEKESEEES